MEYPLVALWIVLGIAALLSYRRLSRSVGMNPSYGFSLVVLVLPGWWVVWFLASYLPHLVRYDKSAVNR